MSKSGLFAHFRSKEQLQLQTLEHARRWFIDTVDPAGAGRPARRARVRALFDAWLRWETEALDGGCVFVTAAVEYDDQPGAMRDALSPASRTGWSSIATVPAPRRGGRLPRRHRPRPVRLRAAGAHARLPPAAACSTTTGHCERTRARPSSSCRRLLPRLTTPTKELHHVISFQKSTIVRFKNAGSAPLFRYRRAARSAARPAARPRPLVHRAAAWRRTARCPGRRAVHGRPRSVPRSAATSGATGRSSTSSTAGAAGAASSPASSSRSPRPASAPCCSTRPPTATPTRARPARDAPTASSSARRWTRCSARFGPADTVVAHSLGTISTYLALRLRLARHRAWCCWRRWSRPSRCSTSSRARSASEPATRRAFDRDARRVRRACPMTEFDARFQAAHATRCRRWSIARPRRPADAVRRRRPLVERSAGRRPGHHRRARPPPDPEGPGGRARGDGLPPRGRRP